MFEAIPLTSHPNLEQYETLARDFQDACQSSDPGAVRQWATRWLETLPRLQGAESSAAREREREAERIELRWNTLATCTLANAQLFIAREHGFASWPQFARHVQEMAGAGAPVSVFEAAAEAIVSGDAAALRRLLADHPGIVKERSTREHRSTLLHYVSANGIEDFRQKTPKNIVEVTNLLLDAGADVDAESDAYGGGCTALGLVATSVHPERAGVQIDLLQALLKRGASFEQPSAGGNNHSIVHACFANGQPKAARFFADLGAPLDLESAAALGRLAVMRSYFDESGALQKDTDAKQLESAFLYACGYGSGEAVLFLLDHGVDPSTRTTDGQTGLHWANYGPHIGVIKLLLERGAAVDAKDNRFHATPLDVALWKWNRTSDGEEREQSYEAVALLARAGAKLDPDRWRDPKEDRSLILERIDSDPRMQAALRGEVFG